MNRAFEERLPLPPGAIVAHKHFGIGRITEVREDPRAELVVEFARHGQVGVPNDLASVFLTRLPEDGFDALSLTDPDRVGQWPQTAPLKLIGAVLVDFGGRAKPAELEDKLHGLLGTRWDSWWKRVQPALKTSPYFGRRADGRYELRAKVTEIPESPLPPVSKRAHAPKPDVGEVQTFINRVEAGEASFDSVRGAENLRVAAKELARLVDHSESARQVVFRALDGAVNPARILLEAMLEAGQQAVVADSLLYLAHHIEALATAQADEKPALRDEKSKPTGEHIAAKTRLLADTLTRITGAPLLDEPERLQSLIEALLRVALIVWHRDHADWRSESVDELLGALAVVAERKPQALDIGGAFLATRAGDIDRRLAVIERWVARTRGEFRTEAVNRLLIGSLSGSVDTHFAADCLARLLRPDEYLRWLSNTAARLLPPRDSPLPGCLAHLLSIVRHRATTPEPRAWLRLALQLASTNSDSERELSPLIAEDLDRILTISASGETTASTVQGSVVGALETVYYARAKLVEAATERMRADLEAEIGQLRETLDTSVVERTRLQRLVEQLQTGYRVPEQWAVHQGRREVLAELATLYQELALSQPVSGPVAEPDHWLTLRLESLLQQHGVSKFGTPGSTDPYNPTLHEYLPGVGGTGSIIQVRCPGFRWQDPAGNAVVLTRAKVVPHR